MKQESKLPVAVLGAGPVGMAAAAHLTTRNLPFILFESGDSVGSSILSWSHIKLFSPWKYNIDKAARTLLQPTGWKIENEEDMHTGQQFVDHYLKPLSELHSLWPHIHTNSKVLSVSRKNLDKMKTKNRENVPFVIKVQHKNGIKIYEANAVIDATGNWLNPNPIGSGGSFAIGELENKSRIFYGIPKILKKDKKRYINKHVAVIGGGHSAINTILELDQLKHEYPGTEIDWILRKPHLKDALGGGESDALEARGALGIKMEKLIRDNRINVYTPFQIQEIQEAAEKLTLIGEQNGILAAINGIDQLISNTGSRPDFSFLTEIRLNINHTVESAEAIADLIDPNVHSCGSVRAHGEFELQHHEKKFYIVGSKSYGRAPTFLMATGYEQVRSVVAALDGDLDAARKVELELPETGVCNSESGSCCNTSPANDQTSTCCA